MISTLPLLIALTTTPPVPHDLWCPVCREVLTNLRIEKIARYLTLTWEVHQLQDELGVITFAEIVHAQQRLNQTNPPPPPRVIIIDPDTTPVPFQVVPDDSNEPQPGWSDRLRDPEPER